MFKVTLATLTLTLFALAPSWPSAGLGAFQGATPTVHRDNELAKAAAERRRAIDTQLNKDAREKLVAAMHDVLHQQADAEQPTDPEPTARAGVKERFAAATGPQQDLLTFYVLADLARITTDEDTLNKHATESTRSGIHELKKPQIARLLALMDQGAPFAVALRRSLDKIASTPDAIVHGIM